MGLWTDIVGSVRGYIRLGLTGVRLKNSSGALAVRNAGDSAYANIECGDIYLGPGNKLVFEGTTDDTYETTIDPGDPTADRTLTLPNKSGTVATTDDVGGMPRSYLSGLGLSNSGTDPTNDIDIAAGACRDSTNAADIVLAATLTKRLDAAWAVGTNQGGRDTGSIANGTYHIWLIKRSDTGVVDALFSASASAPTMPANYDYKRRIGSIIRASGAILAFTQRGDEFLFNSARQDVNSASLDTSAVSVTLSVPTGIKVLARINVGVYSTVAGRYALFSSLDVADQAPNGVYGNAVALVASVAVPQDLPPIRTNTSAQIRARASATITYSLVTRGWFDSRGRDE